MGSDLTSSFTPTRSFGSWAFGRMSEARPLLMWIGCGRDERGPLPVGQNSALGAGHRDLRA